MEKNGKRSKQKTLVERSQNSTRQAISKKRKTAGKNKIKLDFRKFIESLPVMFYVVETVPPYAPIYVSPSFESFGYPISQWRENPDMWVRAIHPEDRGWVLANTEAAIREGRETDFEYRLIARDGAVRWVRDRGCFIRDEKGEAVCWQGFIIDVTERRRTEEALRESEERTHSFFENTPDIIYVHDLEGNYLSLNRAAERIFGYTREEALKMNLRQVVAPDHLEVVKRNLKEKISGASQTTYEVDCIAKDGRRITLEINSTAVYENGKPVAIQGIARDITERKLTEQALKDSEQRYRDLFENANDLLYTHDLEGNITSLNRAGEIITGYTREEALKMNFAQVVAPEFLDLARQKMTQKLKGVQSKSYELEIIAKNGQRVSLELSTRLIYQNGRAVGVQGIGRDITQRKRAEQALRESERRYRYLSEGIMHQVWTALPDGKLDYVNQQTVKYFGRPFEKLIGKGWQDVIHPDDLPECLRRWAHSLETGENYETEFRILHKNGEYRWHLVRATAGRDAEGKIVKWFGTNTDINDQKSAEAKLNHFAKHDPLTNLANRAEFMNHLRAASRQAELDPSFCFAVLFLDLDRFKVINDSLGHAVGDNLLISIAERIKACVRDRDVVARLGGDEFTILLNKTGSTEDVVRVAERLQQSLSEPFNLDGYEVFTSASIGVIISDGVPRKAEDYLRDADTAMYRAKEAGKARYEIFDREMHVRNLNLLRLETDLRRALERDEFEIAYQPIISLENGEILEFEALIRWRHPVRGIIQPNEFIGVAEETGLIVPIGKWVLEEACRQTREWQKRFPLYSALSVSVNLSAKQLKHPALYSQIVDILDRTGLSPRHLKLEVTESTVMEHSDLAMEILLQLRELDISFSTDDFGTGYSSLSYLHKFPFQRLKIDRSFVGAMDTDPKSEGIVRTILMLGQNLNLQTVAEGIETERQLELLRWLGCESGQGYLISKPVDAESAQNILREGLQTVKSAPFLAFGKTLELEKIQ